MTAPIQLPMTRASDPSALLAAQKEAQLREGPPSAATRVRRLERLAKAVLRHERAIIDATSADFGYRSPDVTLLTDVAATLQALKFAKKRVAKWMRPERRSPELPLSLLGGRARVHYQPLGVVGILSPWNFPVYLALSPLAGAIAAGNRAIIKPSEVTPRTAEVLAQLVAEAFSEDEVTVVQGGAEVARAFSHLPFDHLLFTGSPRVGARVMKAAAENLVPVTLELGGKCPVIVGRGADLHDCAVKVMTAKCLNAGQVCLAPDYVLVPSAQRGSLVAALQAATAQLYRGFLDNPDYTSLVNDRQRQRLESVLADAALKGARVVPLNRAREVTDGLTSNVMPPTLVLDATPNMRVLQEEIFGPILPIVSYDTLDDAIGEVRSRAAPLAVYYFGPDKAEQAQVLARTTSGGVCINEVLLHATQEDLPFGGVGASGTGAYHGRDGFLRFSHARAVYSHPRFDLGRLLRPPYGLRSRKLVRSLM